MGFIEFIVTAAVFAVLGHFVSASTFKTQIKNIEADVEALYQSVFDAHAKIAVVKSSVQNTTNKA